MKLNHINLPVHDVNATRDFLTKYFGMVTMMDLGENFLAMLTDEGGMVLNLSHFDKAGSDEIVYHRDFHVGFFVDSNEEVDRVHARFVADGVSVNAPRRLEGRYAFYLQAPGGFPVEVACLQKSLKTLLD